MSEHYIGRFAPSPTGPLHFGSLFTAIASYLDAKANNGQWLVRIEDIDTPRIMQGACESILFTLEAFGLCWDGEVVYQHQLIDDYLALLDALKSKEKVYGCSCSRKEIAEIAHAGVEGPVYPGTCREQHAGDIRAWRFKLSKDEFSFKDEIQGWRQYQLQSELGDFILYRADGLVAYQLAVVADDARAGVTHVIRGMDLIHSTPRQMALQESLGYNHPVYAHLPVVTSTNGQKLSKQNLAPAVRPDQCKAVWHEVLSLLGQNPPRLSEFDGLDDLINWAITHWHRPAIPSVAAIMQAA